MIQYHDAQDATNTAMWALDMASFARRTSKATADGSLASRANSTIDLVATPMVSRSTSERKWPYGNAYGNGRTERAPCGYSKLRSAQNAWRFWHPRHTIVGMITYLSALASLLSFRFRSRASLELELVSLRHQVTVLRRQRPGRARLFCADRLLWVWLYRVWPQVLNAMVLVKPATVVQWHRKGFRLWFRG